MHVSHLRSLIIACATWGLFSAEMSHANPSVFKREDGMLTFRFPPESEESAHLEVDIQPLRCHFRDSTTRNISIQYFFKVNPPPSSWLGRAWDDQWDDLRSLIGVTIDADMDGRPEGLSSNLDSDIDLSGNPMQFDSWNHLSRHVDEMEPQQNDFGQERPSHGLGTTVWNFISFSSHTMSHVRESLINDNNLSNHASMAAAKLRESDATKATQQCVYYYLKHSSLMSDRSSATAKRILPQSQEAIDRKREYIETMLRPGMGEGLVVADAAMIAATVVTLGQGAVAVAGLKSGVQEAGKAAIVSLTKKMTWSTWAKRAAIDGVATFGIGNGIYLGTETWRTSGENLTDHKFWINFAAVGISNFVSGFATNMHWAQAMVLDYGVSAVSGSLAEYMISGQNTLNFFQFQGLWGGVLAQPRVRFFRKILPETLTPRIGAVAAKTLTNVAWGTDQVVMNGLAFGWSADRLTDLKMTEGPEMISPEDFPFVDVNVP